MKSEFNATMHEETIKQYLGNNGTCTHHGHMTSMESMGGDPHHICHDPKNSIAHMRPMYPILVSQQWNQPSPIESIHTLQTQHKTWQQTLGTHQGTRGHKNSPHLRLSKKMFFIKNLWSETLGDRIHSEPSTCSASFLFWSVPA